MEDHQSNLLTLKSVAATAAKVAHDYENHKLWEGDLTRAVNKMIRDLQLVKEDR